MGCVELFQWSLNVIENGNIQRMIMTSYSSFTVGNVHILYCFRDTARYWKSLMPSVFGALVRATSLELHQHLWGEKATVSRLLLLYDRLRHLNTYPRVTHTGRRNPYSSITHCIDVLCLHAIKNPVVQREMVGGWIPHVSTELPHPHAGSHVQLLQLLRDLRPTSRSC